MFEAKRTVLETLASIGYDKEFTVTFVKKDGTPRTMTAKMPVPDKPKFGEPAAIPVWDTVKDAWRSFDPSRVTCITVYKGSEKFSCALHLTYTMKLVVIR